MALMYKEIDELPHVHQKLALPKLVAINPPVRILAEFFLVLPTVAIESDLY
jgi:hypothetical protein